MPAWLQTPGWYRPLTRALGHFVRDHQALGLFGVIFAEEIGIPMPAPGDVVVAVGGFLTTRGDIPLWAAYVAVVAAAVTGSFVLYSMGRRFGHPFLLRYGRFIGLERERFDRLEVAFRRWGPWAVIVGRHIPGLRIYLSALAGIFEVPPLVFAGSVLVSSTIWAAIFINLGRLLGPRTLLLFRLLPAHLVPWLVGVVVVAATALVAWERGVKPRTRLAKPKTASPPAPAD